MTQLDRASRIDELLPLMPRATAKDEEVVYIIQGRDGGPVKIGHTTQGAVGRRVKELQTGNPHQLVVRALFAGGLWLEQAMHELFADSRLVGEWFTVTPRLSSLCPEAIVGG